MEARAKAALYGAVKWHNKLRFGLVPWSLLTTLLLLNLDRCLLVVALLCV